MHEGQRLSLIFPAYNEEKNIEKAVQEFEKEIILDALKRTDYVQTRAAVLLGISRRMLKYRMDTLGISRTDVQSPDNTSEMVQ